MSKGPRRQRGPTNHGNGKKFEPGQNTHTGEVFRRGPDKISRGSGLLMLKQVFHDKRQKFYDSLCEMADTPSSAFAFVTDFADRVDGKPKQTVDHTVRRSTTFAPAPPAPELPSSGAASEADAETSGSFDEQMVRL